MRPLIAGSLLLLVAASGAFAALLDDLTAGNLSATNATVSFQSAVPVTAVLEWGKDEKYGSNTSEQYASDAQPDEAIAGLRALYLDGLEPATEYHWKITAKTADGTTETATGSFTTLPVNAEKKRGPDGSHVPPHTPAYETPATHVAATWEEVNNLLGQCRGGEVIEVAQSDSRGEKTIVLTGGNEAWEKNVLIRPPLGQRAANRTRGVEINSPNLTVAGFNLNHASMYSKYGNHRGNASGIGARRAFFWMCVLERQGMLLANGCPDSGWYEVVAPRRGVGSDRSQIKAYGDVLPDNFTIAGCWLEGKDRTNGKDHSDTLQTLASDDNPIRGLKMIDTVFFRSANCAGQLTHLAGPRIENCWFGPVEVKSKVCGSFYATLGACLDAVIRDSDWNGSFRQNANPKEIRNSSFQKLAQPGEVSENNQIGPELRPQPPVPDLDKIWPK